METSPLSRARRDRAPLRLATAGAFLAALSTAHPGHAEGPVVDVAVRGPGLPELEARADDGPWERACIPPCTLRLDPAYEYRIAGDALVDSDPFRIPQGPPRVRVDAATASPMLRDIATLFIVAGAALAAGGGAALLLPDDPPGGGKTPIGVAFLTVGLLTSALGVVGRIVSETHVTVTPLAEAR